MCRPSLLTITTLGTIIPITIGLLAAVIIPTNTMTSNIPGHVQSIKAELVATENANLDDKAFAVAEIAEQTFEQAINFARLQADYATRIYNGRLNTDNPYQSYYAGPGSLKQVPGTLGTNLPFPDPSYLDQSAYFLRGYEDLSEAQRDALIPQLNNASHLTNVFRTSFLSTKEYFGSYMGFEENGLWFSHPWFDLDGHPTKTFTCARTGRAIVGYDARCRGWYHQAYTEPDDIPILTPPYNDATTNMLMITIAHKVYRPDHTLVGVIGIDLLIDTLSSAVANSRVLDSGYTFMIDHEKKIVIHPDKDDDSVESITTRELPNANSRDIAEFDTLTDAMVAREIGSGTFTKNDEVWYMSYHPVRNTPYSIAVVVRESEIHAPANALQESIDEAMEGFVIPSAVVGAIVVLISWIVLFKGVSKFAGNLDRFNKMLTAMGKQDYGVVAGTAPPASAEMRVLGDAISRMAMSVKTANEAYMNGNLNEAKTGYSGMYDLMKSRNNTRAMGICANNLANTLKKLNPRDPQALHWYNLSIEHGNALWSEYNTKGDTAAKNTTRVVLANRLANRGTYYADISQYSKAAKDYGESIKVHQEQDNMIGVAKASGAYGMMLLRQHRIEEAEAKVNDAYANLLSKAGSLASPLPLQYAAYYRAKVHSAQHQYAEAEGLLTWILQGNEKTDAFLFTATMTELGTCFTAQGKATQATEVAKIVGTAGMGVQARYVSMVLDYSYSMSGGRINTCIDRIKSIVDVLGDTDNLNFYLFGTRVTPVINDYTQVGPHREWIKGQVDAQRSPDGRTAFYTAIKTSLQKAIRETGENETWVVALTDGIDNESRRGDLEQVQHMLKSANNLKLILITIDDQYDARALGRIVDTANSSSAKSHGVSGMHMKAKSGAIADVFHRIEAMLTDLNVERM